VQASHNQKQKTKPNTANAGTDQRGAVSVPLIVETHSRSDSPDESAKRKAENDTKEYRDSWTFKLTVLNAVFTGVLAIVGVGGICVAIRSLRALEVQTKATQDSVNVLINSERAWVVISAARRPELMAVSPGAMPPYNAFRFVLKNEGRTVAKLVELVTETHIVQLGYTLPTPPAYMEKPPPPDELGFHHGTVLAPGATLETWDGMHNLFDGVTVQQIRDGQRFLYVYGFVRYFDFAKEERKLQFCYLYMHRAFSQVVDSGPSESWPRWVVAGPADYNTHT
jgi:hypothetical protein